MAKEKQNVQAQRLREHLKLIEQAEDFVAEKVTILANEVSKLCEKIEPDKIALQEFIAKKDSCDDLAREQLLKYQRAYDRIAFKIEEI
jgi:hypothetical protein